MSAAVADPGPTPRRYARSESPYVPSATVWHGDCLDVLRGMPDDSVDSVVTDPPYGLSDHTSMDVAAVVTAWCSGDRKATPRCRGGFMSMDWDSFVPPPAVWDKCLRVLKPGGHTAVFAGTGTTGEAALRLGLDSVLIEREGRYRPHIHQRLTRTPPPR